MIEDHEKAEGETRMGIGADTSRLDGSSQGPLSKRSEKDVYRCSDDSRGVPRGIREADGLNMLAIVRVTRQQLDELYFRLQPQNRNILKELTIGHVYVAPGNVLYVCDADTELFQFPADKPLSVAETIREMVMARVKKDGYEQVTGG